VDEKVIIIGAGPAGMAAAIYLQRAGLSPLVLECGKPGGLLRSANLVENYPGFPEGIRGTDLIAKFESHLKRVGARITKAKVIRVAAKPQGFSVKTDKGWFTTSCALVATGTRPKKVELQGSAHLLGRRIFNEITEIRGSVRGKKIVIIGGGDAAFDYALNLDRKGGRVIVVARSEPRCLPLLRDRARSHGIKVMKGVSLKGVKKDAKRLILRIGLRGKDTEIAPDLILMACGRTPNLEILAPDLQRKLDSRGGLPETNIPGLYLAGDVARGEQRQTGIAVGDGICAAMLIHAYLDRRVTP